MLINNINPVFLKLGPLTIRWYGLFLALGVMLAILIYTKLFKEKKYKIELLYDIVIWLVIGGLIGARLGHVFFYNWKFFFQNPLEIIFINHGGLSSHGMTIGLLITLLIYKKIKKIKLKKYLDLLVIPIPLIASFIRLGNYFNSEIIGKPTALPWGVWFQHIDAKIILRHPSQIYESLISLSIFFIIYFIYKKYQNRLPQFFIFYIFLFLYFFTRFFVEFVKKRQTLEGILSMGQWLSIPFIIWSVWWFIDKIKKQGIKNPSS